MDVEFCLHSCAKTDVKQGSGTKLNLCVRATASQIPYTHNLEFYVHGSCWKSVFVAANHSKLDIQAIYVFAKKSHFWQFAGEIRVKISVLAKFPHNQHY